MNFERLHLGASRLEKLSSQTLEFFLDKSVYHLGDEVLFNPNNKSLLDVDYSKTNFYPFKYSKGGKLPFEDNYFSFIYSEHFFEHLFLDEAVSLFLECNRILKKDGVIRTVVPDADLRPVPEILGFPKSDISYTHPSKHKTRWSIYSLPTILEMTGFNAIAIRYYDINHILIENNPSKVYSGCNNIDEKMVLNTSYIKRPDSLIVDGKK